MRDRQEGRKSRVGIRELQPRSVPDVTAQAQRPITTAKRVISIPRRSQGRRLTASRTARPCDDPHRTIIGRGSATRRCRYRVAPARRERRRRGRGRRRRPPPGSRSTTEPGDRCPTASRTESSIIGARRASIRAVPRARPARRRRGGSRAPDGDQGGGDQRGQRQVDEERLAADRGGAAVEADDEQLTVEHGKRDEHAGRGRPPSRGRRARRRAGRRTGARSGRGASRREREHGAEPGQARDHDPTDVSRSIPTRGDRDGGAHAITPAAPPRTSGTPSNAAATRPGRRVGERLGAHERR